MTKETMYDQLDHRTMILKPFPRKNMNLVLSLIIKEKKKIIIENPKKVRLQTYTSKTRMVRKLAI